MRPRRAARHGVGMTETSTPPPPPTDPPATEPPPAAPPSAPARPLYRDPDDRVIAGVCAAAGRYTGTDPVLWRVAVAVLAIFGGTGIVLYVLGWLLLPQRTKGRSLAETWVHRRGRPWSTGTVAVIALVAVIVLGGLDDGRSVTALAILALVGYLVYRDRQGAPVRWAAAPPVTGSPWTDSAPTFSPGTESAAAPGVDPASPADLFAPPWPPPPPPRPRSALGLATLSLAAVVSGCLAWAASSGADGIEPTHVVAAALLVVGGGLVVGTVLGRARWLIAVGIVLSLVLAGTAGAQASGVSLDGGVGERLWVVGVADREPSYTLGVGEATLDLTRLPADGPHVVVRARVSLGHLVVLVPAGLPVRVRGTVQLGDITEFGLDLAEGSSVERTRSYGPPGDPRVEVEAVVGTGQIEVRRG